MRLVVAVIGASLALPASAIAAEPTLVMREVPLHAAARTTAAATARFDMLGLHWRGEGEVSYRVRLASGRWSGWRVADADDRVQRGWRLGGLDWTGEATAARFRTHGDVTRLRAYYVQSPVEGVAPRRLQTAESPLIASRFSWQADESIRRGTPQYADSIAFAVVHHTAGTNGYTRAQSAAIVRGIEVYHVKGNGWNDIGYNFLVDKYGQVFEGRYGGIDRAVVGAHAQGFNTGSVGVAVLGSYGSTGISAAAKTSLEQLLAWKLDLAHVDPLSTLTWRSGGNPRFASGVPVFLRAISGHRDTGFTDCPGGALYAQLPQIARDVAALGGPKIYAPLAQRLGEGQVRFTAKLSTAQPWTVTVAGPTGVQVAQGSGTGASVDWTWDGSAAPSDRYTWTIASPDARPATGTLGATPALALQKTSASPQAVAPGETVSFAYTLPAPATVTATLVSPTGDALATLLSAAKPAGAQTLAFTPPPGLFNGRYALVLAAAAAGRTVTATIPFTIDDMLTGFAVTRASATFTLNRAPLGVTLQVTRGATVVAAPPVAAAIGAQTVAWPTLPDGSYTVTLSVTDDIGTVTRSTSVVVDTIAPKVRVISYRRLRFAVSEPATLTLYVGSKRYVRTLKSAGVTQFWLRTRFSAYRMVARDAAGNTSAVRYRR